jgi:hypothetical protein
MTLREHLNQIERGDTNPRVVEHNQRKPTRYMAWTPTWEGPSRSDYAAAYSDLLDRKA